MKATFRLLVVNLALVCAASAGVVDEALYQAAPDDKVIDSGVMLVSRGDHLISREAFQVVRRSDGGRTIVSTVRAADESFSTQARWDYDAGEQAQSAIGWGRHGERFFRVVLATGEPAATMTVTYKSGQQDVHRGACPDHCLMDMMPGGLPQFTMTRRYDYDQGGVQGFRWMAFMLHQDMRSFDVEIDFLHAGDFKTRRADGTEILIRHYVFDEKGTLDGVGEQYGLHSNLWVDEQHRPIKFLAGGTVGLRAGYEDVEAQLVAQ